MLSAKVEVQHLLGITQSLLLRLDLKLSREGGAGVFGQSEVSCKVDGGG